MKNFVPKSKFSFLIIGVFIFQAMSVRAASPLDVAINEIAWMGTQNSVNDEWIEISNQNNFEVDLKNWKLEDKIGKAAIFTFPRDIKIPAQGFLVLRRVDTKITLNNDEDGLSLTCPDGTVADSASYKDSHRGQSYNRFGDEWFWSESLTPMAVNIPSIEKLEEKVKNYSSKNNTGQDENTQITKNELAAASKYFPKNSNPWVAFLLASGIAALSGLIIIFIKRKLRRNIAKQIEPK